MVDKKLVLALGRESSEDLLAAVARLKAPLVASDPNLRAFIIETHSEHLVLRIMKRMRETLAKTLPPGAPRATPHQVVIYFVEVDQEQTIVREMPINEAGDLVKAWPGGFFEERLPEMLE